MRTIRWACLAAVLVSVAACGPDGDAAGGGGGETTTPRALAAVLVEKVGDPTYAEASEGVDYYGDGAVGATIRIDVRDVPEDQVQLVVGDDLPDELTSCDAEPVTRDECATLGGAVLTWAEEEPEEDPGTITVVVPKGDGWAVATQSGPSVTSDPRRLDLAVSVDDLLALARDDRVGPTTTAAAIAAGDDLATWRGPDENPVYEEG